MALIGSECGGVEREVLTEKEEDGNETCDKSGLLNSGEAGYSGANSTVDGPSMNFAADPLIPGECSSHSDPTNVENWIDQSSPQPVIPAPIEPYLDPPENFSHVVGRIFRSSFPRVENFEFLKTLKLKSILILIPEQYPEENLQFMRENNIQVLQVGMSGNKEPFVNVSHETITKALEIAINPENHPLLIHCNRGKHRTGCLVGCIRRLQKWSLTMIFDEYRKFANPKARPLDQQLIELYDESHILKTAQERNWLPIEW